MVYEWRLGNLPQDQNVWMLMWGLKIRNYPVSGSASGWQLGTPFAGQSRRGFSSL